VSKPSDDGLEWEAERLYGRWNCGTTKTATERFLAVAREARRMCEEKTTKLRAERIDREAVIKGFRGRLGESEAECDRLEAERDEARAELERVKTENLKLKEQAIEGRFERMGLEFGVDNLVKRVEGLEHGERECGWRNYLRDKLESAEQEADRLEQQCNELRQARDEAQTELERVKG
jgi:chromosome segregation ATPase